MYVAACRTCAAPPAVQVVLQTVTDFGFRHGSCAFQLLVLELLACVAGQFWYLSNIVFFVCEFRWQLSLPFLIIVTS